eukprot:1823847-Rhodomonas_salina.1
MRDLPLYSVRRPSQIGNLFHCHDFRWEELVESIPAPQTSYTCTPCFCSRQQAHPDPIPVRHIDSASVAILQSLWTLACLTGITYACVPHRDYIFECYEASSQ